MKKAFGLLLVFAMMFCLLAGCSSAKDKSGSFFDAGDDKPTSSPVLSSGNASGSLDNAHYVMIYNPYLYDASMAFDDSSLYTGSIGSQVDTEIFRGDDLPPVEITTEHISPNDLGGFEPGSMPVIDPQRAGGLAPVYAKYDTHSFFYNSTKPRDFGEFTCVYEGEHCYIWSLGSSISESYAESLGIEFDSNIYPLETRNFGAGRFTEDGGKANILFYPMGYGDLVRCGFFMPADLLSEEENPYWESDEYNVDHAIININSDVIGKDLESGLNSTIAHEYQHLICFSNDLRGGHSRMMNKWLNEGMSGYAEQLYEPGEANLSRAYNLYASGLVNRGMSLYNFTTTSDDIGCYGSVMAFTVYLSGAAGDNVFSDVQYYWGSYGCEDSEASVIAAALPSSYRSEIENSVSYPGSVTASMTEDEILLSKVTLNFWVSTLDAGLMPVSAEYTDYFRKAQLYAEINPTYIEGGGRIVFKTMDGHFDIPSDAEGGLIYVGLDENYNITGIVTTEP